MAKSVHYRRCHICGKVNVAEGQSVQRCTECGKSLSPFFYFKEDDLKPYQDNLEEITETQTSGYHPIWGITAIW